MFGGRSSRRGGRDDGPVSIPRGERVQLRRGGPSEAAPGSSLDGGGGVNKTVKPLLPVLPPPEPTLPQAHEASQGPAWYGQTLEYATGVCLRQQVLEPILAEDEKALPEETARFLSYYSRGDLLFLQNSSGAVHVANVERVTTMDAPTIAAWWDQDKCLPETGSEDWSRWWIQRCHLFDPGCEMVKLMGESGEILGMAYFERHVVDNRNNGDGKRITLIRGLRIHPKLNPETVRRSSATRNATGPISYPDVASSLLHYIIFASIRYGTQGIAVNSPKSDTIEDFYQQYFGIPITMKKSDGRRLFRMSAKSRFEIMKQIFIEQLVLMTEYKEQTFLRKDAASEEQEYVVEDNEVPTPVQGTVELLVPAAEDPATAVIIPVKTEPVDAENRTMEEIAPPLTVFVGPQKAQLEAPPDIVVALEEGEAKVAAAITSPTIVMPTVYGAPSNMVIESEEDTAGDEDCDANQQGEATNGAIKNDQSGRDAEDVGSEVSDASSTSDKAGESGVIGIAEEAATSKDPASQHESESEPIEKSSPLKGEASRQVSSAADSWLPASEKSVAEASLPEESEVDTLVLLAEASPPVQDYSVVETNEETVGNLISSVESLLSGKEESTNETSAPTEGDAIDDEFGSNETSQPAKEKSVVEETGKLKPATDIPIANGKRSLDEDPVDVDVEIKRLKVNEDLMQEDEEVKAIQGEEEKQMKEPQEVGAQTVEELADEDGGVFDDAEYFVV